MSNAKIGYIVVAKDLLTGNEAVLLQLLQPSVRLNYAEPFLPREYEIWLVASELMEEIDITKEPIPKYYCNLTTDPETKEVRIDTMKRAIIERDTSPGDNNVN